MRHALRTAILGVAILAQSTWAAPQPVGVGGGDNGLGGLQPAAVGGLKVSVKAAADALALTFDKAGPERRLLAVEGAPQGDLSWVKTIAATYQLDLTGGEARLAVVLFDQDGGVWYKIAGETCSTGAATDASLSVKSLSQATFSEDQDNQLGWNALRRVWLGIVIDGQAKGTLKLLKAQFSPDEYKPSKPLAVAFKDAKAWSTSQDGAVKSTLTTPNAGPDGQLCLQLDVTFPAGRHMYCLPAVGLPRAEMDGYRALSFKLKGAVPKPIGKLLVSVFEADGSQYYMEPADSAEWQTIELPFDKFKLGSWTKDENDQLDLGQVNRVSIGCHGTAEGDGKGLLTVCDIKFVP